MQWEIWPYLHNRLQRSFTPFTTNVAPFAICLMVQLVGITSRLQRLFGNLGLLYTQDAKYPHQALLAAIPGHLAPPLRLPHGHLKGPTSDYLQNVVNQLQKPLSLIAIAFWTTKYFHVLHELSCTHDFEIQLNIEPSRITSRTTTKFNSFLMSKIRQILRRFLANPQHTFVTNHHSRLQRLGHFL